jgi:hypothetical protein
MAGLVAGFWHGYIQSITYDTNLKKQSFGGIFGARIFNLKNIIRPFTDAKDAAEKLNGKEWD